MTGTEANNSNDTPGGTTWADHQRARAKREGERKEAEEGSTNAPHSHKEANINKRNMQTYSSIRYERVLRLLVPRESSQSTASRHKYYATEKHSTALTP